MNLNINAYKSACTLLLHVLIFQHFDLLDLSSSGDAFASYVPLTSLIYGRNMSQPVAA